MPKYMFNASYTLEGVKGLLEVGGSSRAAAVDKLVESVGGSVVGFYFSFGDDDAIIIADLPDDAAAAALSLGISASGAATVKTTVLLDMATMDDAVQRGVDYTPPGN